MIDRPGAGFIHGTVEVFGHEVGWASAGAGQDVLVICPGSAGTDVSWAKDMLSTRMRVIELNPPGWGGREPLRYKIDQRELAIVLAAAVESLGISRYHLHGASMGGVTALWLAMQFPERVRSLSVEGGMNFVREEHLVSIENVKALAAAVARNDPDGTGYPRAAPHPRKPWADEQYFRTQMRKRIPMMRRVTHLHEPEIERRMSELSLPVLVLLGDQDELLRPNHLERWREINPAAKTLLIAGAAHDIQNTQPEQLVDALRAHHAAAGFH
jgi:pimeloyl-ACP methyl ester carboxylesterase